MYRYNEQELLDVLPQFFIAPVEIIKTDFCPESDETGYTEDMIAFMVQVPPEHASFTEIRHKEILIYRVDWEELILLCHITVSDYEKLRPLEYRTETLHLSPNTVTFNDGTKATKIIEKHNGTLVDVIDTFKPVPK